MNFAKFYFEESLKINFKEFSSVSKIDENTYKYIHQYLIKIKNKKSGLIFKNKEGKDFKVLINSIVVIKDDIVFDVGSGSMAFVTKDGWDDIDEVIECTLVNSGKIYLFVLSNTKTQSKYYYIAVDNEFKKKTNLNMFTLLKYLGVKKEDFEKRVSSRNVSNAVPEEKKKHFDEEAVKDKYGYYNIDEGDYETLVRDFDKIEKKYYKKYKFVNDIGSGYKYKIKYGEDEGVVYLFLFIKKLSKKYKSDGQLVFSYPSSFEIAQKIEMLKFNFIGYQRGGMKTKKLFDMSQLTWLDKPPQELSEEDFKELSL